MGVNVLSIIQYMQTKFLADKEKTLPKDDVIAFEYRGGKMKEGARVSGRKMDELITALMRRGRGRRTPLHHPALTAAGQRQRRRQTGGDSSSLSPWARSHSCQHWIRVPQQQPSEQLSRLAAAVRASLKGTDAEPLYPPRCDSSAGKL